MKAKPTLVLSTREDILAAVPYLLHYHPADSMVVVGFAGSTLRFTTRWDLPGEPSDLIALLVREETTRVVLAGFGAGHLVTPAMEQTLRLVSTLRISVIEALRAEDGRYWSYLCDKPACCPPEGVPYDTVASPIATEAVLHGLVALPSRHDLTQSVLPCVGRARTAMSLATAATAAHLRTRLAALNLTAARSRRADAFARRFVADGIDRVHTALDLYTGGKALDDADAARLGFDLAVVRVRDEAWSLFDDGHVHIRLWKDLTRRLEPQYVAPAASLLAAAAWHTGDCTLASLALDRALSADPDYSMAHLINSALHHLLSARSLRRGMPGPDELDAQMGPPRGNWLIPLATMLAAPAAEQAG